MEGVRCGKKELSHLLTEPIRAIVMRKYPAMLIALLFTLTAFSQSNVITGNLSSFNLEGRSNVTMTLNLVAPLRRVYNGKQISDDPRQTTSDSDGNFAFTNVIWGRYQLEAGDSSATAYTLTVYTNTTGEHTFGELIGTGTLPPNPATNYATISQLQAVDANLQAQIDSIPSGSGTVGLVSSNDASIRITPSVISAGITNFGIDVNTNVIASVANLAATNAAGTNSALAAAQALDATVAANANAAIGVLSNLTVTFTVTTNLSYTNFPVSVMASNGTFNANWVWDTGRYVRSDGTNKFITYSAASNSWIMGSITGPNLPSAFTNDTLTGQYDTNQLQSTAPYVYFPSNAIITTNWFIAGASFKLPLTAIEAEDYGARGDAVKLYAATVASGNLICTNAAFTAEDVGKSVAIYSTATNSAYDLAKIIAFNNPTNVLLSTNFTRSTPYEAWYGTDNRVAISNALNSFTKDGLVNLNGKYGSVYMFASAILDPTNLQYAVINVPTDRSTGLLTNTSRTIVLNGQTPPMVYPAFLNAGGTSTLGTPNNGTILLNFAKPVSGSTNVFVYHDGTGAGGSQFARERFVMNNLTLRQPGQPTHHGVFLKRGGTTYLRNFAIDVDQSPNWLNATSGVPPFYMQGIVSNANTVYGIYGPDPYNYAGVTLENVTVSYHGTAYRFGEHTMGIGKVTGVACGALYESDGAFGSQGTWNGGTFPFLYSYLCQYRIVIATNSTLREPLVIGNLTVEEGYPRADIGPLVYDPYKRGDINIGAITGNGQNTTIESTNGSWNNTILNFSYDRGVIHSNGVVYGSGAGLTGVPFTGLSGTATLAQLPGTAAKLDGSGYVTNGIGTLFAGAPLAIFSNTGTSTNILLGNRVTVEANTGVITGNGSSLTNLPAASLTGTVTIPVSNSFVASQAMTNNGVYVGNNVVSLGSGSIALDWANSVGYVKGSGAMGIAAGWASGSLAAKAGLVVQTDQTVTLPKTIAATNGCITPIQIINTYTNVGILWTNFPLVVTYTNAVLLMGSNTPALGGDGRPLKVAPIGTHSITLYSTNGGFVDFATGIVTTNLTWSGGGVYNFVSLGTNWLKLP